MGDRAPIPRKKKKKKNEGPTNLHCKPFEKHFLRNDLIKSFKYRSCLTPAFHIQYYAYDALIIHDNQTQTFYFPKHLPCYRLNKRKFFLHLLFLTYDGVRLPAATLNITHNVRFDISSMMIVLSILLAPSLLTSVAICLRVCVSLIKVKQHLSWSSNRRSDWCW